MRQGTLALWEFYFIARRKAAPSNTWSCFAHMVTDLGQGFHSEGETFEWKPNKRTEGTPRLNEEQAAMLMSRVLELYRRLGCHVPGKVVIPKDVSLQRGRACRFEDSLREIQRHALVSVSKSGTFVLRPGRRALFSRQPVPVSVGERSSFTSRDMSHFCEATRGIRMPQYHSRSRKTGKRD